MAMPLRSSVRTSRLRLTHGARRSFASKADISEAEVNSARAYCSDLLRRFDSPSYTLQAFIPPAARDAYLAIRAFNVDVAQIADATSNPTVGAMRMQFWRDAVTNSLAGSPPKEPVAILLAAAAENLHDRTDGKARLSKSWLLRIIDTRQQYLGNPPYPDLVALERYAENTYSTLMYLTLSALPMASVTVDHLASHIGKAQGIAAILRGLPLIAFPSPPKHHSNQAALGGISGTRQGAVLLPLDVMANAGVKEEEVLRKGAEAPGLRDAVFAVATRANDHLITAREMLKNLQAGRDAGHEYEHQDELVREHIPNLDPERDAQPGGQQKDVEHAFGVLMPAVATSGWLGKLEKLDFDIFAPQLRMSDWKLSWRAYWAYNRRKF